jgi:tetratricopeptide (TPR) repeat protein
MPKSLRAVLAAVLLGLVAGCAHTPQPDKLPKLRAYVPSFKVPDAVTSRSYKNQREIYDALPVHTPQRDLFRQRLLTHLLGQLDGELRAGAEAEAQKTFVAAVTLFHPREVFLGRPRSPELARAAVRIAAVFAPRGDEERVMLALCVQMTLGGDDPQARARIREMMDWVDEAQQLVHGPAARGQRLVQVLDKVSRHWPSAFVVDKLRTLYVDRRMILARAMSGEAYRHLRLALPSLLQGAAFQTGYSIARLYLTVDRPYDALNRLRELVVDNDQDTELRAVLEQAVAPTANVRDQVRLAEHFEDRDREVALRICEAATDRFPQHAAGYECLGRLAAATERHYLAVTALERAVQLAPDQLLYAETLAKHYQRRLFEMIGDDHLEEAEAEMVRIEAFYRRVELRFKTKLKPSLARVYYAIGHGYFNAGNVARASAAFQRSVASEPTPDALVQLATIRIKKEDAPGALAHLARAEEIARAVPADMVFWDARLRGLRGRALELAGKAEEGRREHTRAVEAWRRWQSVGLQPDAQAEAFIYEAQSLYSLGNKSRALEALERAIDVQPDRKETYADVIAMLITHGHLPEALDALHRALGRAGVSEYLKTYCSLWVIGLARRAGMPPDELALQHLRRLAGSSWYVRLAQLTLEKVSYDDLLKEARTIGNRAELYYYRADWLLAKGKLQEARELWRKVLETDMLGFYEFEMSFFNLRNGAAKVNTRPLDRQSH